MISCTSQSTKSTCGSVSVLVKLQPTKIVSFPLFANANQILAFSIVPKVEERAKWTRNMKMLTCGVLAKTSYVMKITSATEYSALNTWKLDVPILTFMSGVFLYIQCYHHF